MNLKLWQTSLTSEKITHAENKSSSIAAVTTTTTKNYTAAISTTTTTTTTTTTIYTTTTYTTTINTYIITSTNTTTYTITTYTTTTTYTIATYTTTTSDDDDNYNDNNIWPNVSKNCAWVYCRLKLFLSQILIAGNFNVTTSRNRLRRKSNNRNHIYITRHCVMKNKE